LGGRDHENSGVSPAQAKSSQDLISINKNLGMVHACHTSYTRSINRIEVQAYLGIKAMS
jgi:hypothetical protein